MYHLNDDQLRLIQAYLDKSIVELGEIGLELEIETDMAAWVRFMETAPGIGRINTTYDPRFSNATSENCFWIHVKNQADQIVGCVCSRYFETSNFLDLIRNNLLFFDKKPIRKHVEMKFEIPDDCPVIGGRVGHGGGLWVHPDYRKVGLSSILAPVVRGLAVRHFDIDWNTVAIRNTANRIAMFKENFGYADLHICTTGYWPPYGEDLDVQIMYISRARILALMEAYLLAPSPLTQPEIEPAPRKRVTRRRASRGAA